MNILELGANTLDWGDILITLALIWGVFKIATPLKDIVNFLYFKVRVKVQEHEDE